LYNEFTNTLRWLGIPHADFVVTAYENATSTTPVATARVPSVERDIATGANATHNRVVVFSLSELDLTEDETYFVRVQAVPDSNNLVRGATPTAYWGTPGPRSGAIEVVYTAPVFDDVLPTAWYFNAVMYVYANEIMLGVADGTFAPNATLTRAMMVTILYRLAGEPDVANLDNPFTDVREGLWYTDAIKWAYAEGVTTGATATTFEPMRPVTKQELAAFIARDQDATDRAPDSIVEDFEWPDFDDVASWAREYVSVLTAQNLFRDIPGDNFEPTANATRAMVAAVLARWLAAIG